MDQTFLVLKRGQFMRGRESREIFSRLIRISGRVLRSIVDLRGGIFSTSLMEVDPSLRMEQLSEMGTEYLPMLSSRWEWVRWSFFLIFCFFLMDSSVRTIDLFIYLWMALNTRWMVYFFLGSLCSYQMIRSSLEAEQRLNRFSDCLKGTSSSFSQLRKMAGTLMLFTISARFRLSMSKSALSLMMDFRQLSNNDTNNCGNDVLFFPSSIANSLTEEKGLSKIAN